MTASTRKSGTSQPLDHVTEQGLAAWIERLNQERRMPLYEALDALKAELNGRDRALAGALRELDWAREMIGDPRHILGSDKTKHGEIAEIVEVGIRRARDVLERRPPDAIWNSADRMAPDDYSIHGTMVQSKFVNGLNNELQHILDHASKYPEFGTVDRSFYHIPRDHYETLQKILAGDTDGLSAKTVTAIREKIERLEQVKERSFGDLVRPASTNYPDVQQGRINQTMDQQEASLHDENQAIKHEIKAEHQEDIDRAKAEVAPKISELGRVTLTGAAVGGGLQLTVAIYQKWTCEGKPPTMFTADDWREVGGQTLSGAVTGGVSAATLYGLTNYSALSAPFAGAIVSSGRAMATLVRQYRSGAISYDEFTNLSLVTAAEAGIVAVGAALGQTLIPIPLLGAVIGSSIARIAATNSKRYLGEQGDAFAQRMEAEFNHRISQIDAENRAILARLDAQLLRLGDLTLAAFDFDLNARLLLSNSIRLAKAYGVPDKRIIRTTDDVDLFIRGPAVIVRDQSTK